MKIPIVSITLIATILCRSLFTNPPPIGTSVPLSFDLEELLIDVSTLPSGWQASEVLSDSTDDIYLDLGQQADRYIEFTTETFKSPTIHHVFLYPNKESAEYWYQDNLTMQFHNANRVTPWESPVELNYQSPIADQFRFDCAAFQHATDPSKHFTRCVAVGQYDRVISVFSTYISPNTMGYADLEQVLKAIDRRMATDLKPQ
jgi:hypothetical protein